MPRLSNTALIGQMIESAAARGWDVGEPWWNDEAELDRRWGANHWPYDPGAAGGLECGAAVGWFSIMDVDDELSWMLIAFGPRGIDGWDVGDLKPPREVYKLASVVNKATARFDARMPREPISVGQRIACTTHDGRGLLALATAVDSLGRALRVQLRPHGAEYAALDFARKWFGVRERELGFDALWPLRGEFPAYISMVIHLAGADKKARNAAGLPQYVNPKKKAAGAAAKGAQPLGAVPPGFDSAATSLVMPAAADVARLAEVRRKASAQVKAWEDSGALDPTIDGVRSAALAQAVAWFMSHE